MKSRTVSVRVAGRQMRMIVLQPERADSGDGPFPGILWIHGGGYNFGWAESVYYSCAKILAKRYGAVIISPKYQLAGKRPGRAPYPAALRDCYAALKYLYAHAEELGVRRDRIIVGGESAGGGLAVAVCLYARDQGEIPVALQLPLYPMIDCEDTESSRNNHGYIWNTKRNHEAWKRYLGEAYGSGHVSKYASPARETDLTGMPRAYTFVTDGEPFYAETLTYIRRLREAGVEAAVDVYHGKTHTFERLLPWSKNARDAKRKLCEVYEDVLRRWQEEDAARERDEAADPEREETC